MKKEMESSLTASLDRLYNLQMSYVTRTWWAPLKKET